MTACPYRSLEPVLHERLVEVRERQELEALHVEVARGVASRRVGRALGSGAAGVFGAGALLLGLGSFLESSRQQWMRGEATTLLLAALPVALVVGALARVLCRSLLLRDEHVPMTGNAGFDLARLEEADPLRRARDLARRWEASSTALPLVALSLLAPLTLHAIVWFALTHPEWAKIPGSLEDFGLWIGFSALLVGHSHLAVLICSVRWASKLRVLPTADLMLPANRRWGAPLLWAAGLACLPGVLLVAIPPMLALVTGLAFIPFMYLGTVRVLQRERVALGVD